MRRSIIVYNKKKLSTCVRQLFQSLFALLVIRLGFEPRTPSLKGMCSTCWASESTYSAFFQKRCKGKTFFLLTKKSWCKTITYFVSYFRIMSRIYFAGISTYLHPVSYILLFEMIANKIKLEIYSIIFNVCLIWVQNWLFRKRFECVE